MLDSNEQQKDLSGDILITDNVESYFSVKQQEIVEFYSSVFPNLKNPATSVEGIQLRILSVYVEQADELTVEQAINVANKDVDWLMSLTRKQIILGAEFLLEVLGDDEDAEKSVPYSATIKTPVNELSEKVLHSNGLYSRRRTHGMISTK